MLTDASGFVPGPMQQLAGAPNQAIQPEARRPLAIQAPLDQNQAAGFQGPLPASYQARRTLFHPFCLPNLPTHWYAAFCPLGGQRASIAGARQAHVECPRGRSLHAGCGGRASSRGCGEAGPRPRGAPLLRHGRQRRSFLIHLRCRMRCKRAGTCRADAMLSAKG